MVYKKDDMIQAFVGSFSAVLLFFSLRQGDPLYIDPKIGLFLGVIWLWIIFNFDKKRDVNHYIGNLLIVGILTGALTVWFGMGTKNQLLSFDYFGSSAWIALWIGFPVAMVFDQLNLTNPLSRTLVRK